MKLYAKTVALARRVTLTPDEVRAHIGVSYRWLSKVRSGEIPNPGVLHIEALYELLQRKKRSKKRAK